MHSPTRRPTRKPRGSTLAGWAVGLGLGALLLLLLDAPRLNAGHVTPALPVADLALFSEARYARHPGLSDHHAAFQDHPLALEHFPAGSLMPPPARAQGARP